MFCGDRISGTRSDAITVEYRPQQTLTLVTSDTTTSESRTWLQRAMLPVIVAVGTLLGVTLLALIVKVYCVGAKKPVRDMNRLDQLPSSVQQKQNPHAAVANDLVVVSDSHHEDPPAEIPSIAAQHGRLQLAPLA